MKTGRTMTTNSTMTELTEQYRTLWSRVYAPLRRALAGTWINRDGSESFSLTLGEHGTFRLRSLTTHTDSAGRYTVVGKNGTHYLALEPTEGPKLFLRIEDVDSLRLRVALEDKGVLLDLKKQTTT